MKSSIYKKVSAFNKKSKPLPKYNLGGGYGINMGQSGMSGAGMASSGISAVSSMIPEGQQESGATYTDQAGVDKQNLRTDRLNKASKGLATAATAVQAIPVVGQIGGAVLG